MAQITYPDKNTGDQMTGAEVTEIKTVVNQNEAEIYNSLYDVGFTYNELAVVNQNAYWDVNGNLQVSGGSRAISYITNAVTDRVIIIHSVIELDNTQLVCYMDSNGDLISKEGIGTNTPVDYSGYELSIPLNCTELRIASNGTEKVRIAKKHTDIANDTTRKEQLITATKKLEKLSYAITQGEYYAASGIVQGAGWAMRTELDVNGDEFDIHITQIIPADPNIQGAIYFDSAGGVISREYIGSLDGSVNLMKAKLTIPASCVKIGFSCEAVLGEKNWYIEKSTANAVQYSQTQEQELSSLGDSITSGSESSGISYVDTINAIIRPQWVNNLGVAGATCMEVGATAKLATQVASVGSGKIDIITVNIGVNDYLRQSNLGDVDTVLAKDYSSLLDGLSFTESFRLNIETLLVNNPSSKIFIINPINCSTTEPIPLESYRESIRGICDYLAIPVIEAGKESRLTLAKPTDYIDGLHPTIDGQGILGIYISNEITKRFLV